MVIPSILQRVCCHQMCSFKLKMYQNRFRTPPAGEAYDASLDSLIGRRGRDSPISLPFDTFSVSRGGPSPRRAGPRPQRVLRRLCNDLVRMSAASLGDLTPAQCTSVESAVWTRRSAVSTAACGLAGVIALYLICRYVWPAWPIFRRDVASTKATSTSTSTST